MGGGRAGEALDGRKRDDEGRCILEERKGEKKAFFIGRGVRDRKEAKDGRDGEDENGVEEGEDRRGRGGRGGGVKSVDKGVFYGQSVKKMSRKEIEMNGFEFIGYLAGIFTAFCFLPQSLKTLKTRRTEDISALSYTMYTLGLAGWLVYGVYLHSVQMMIFNAISLVFALSILTVTFYNLCQKRK